MSTYFATSNIQGEDSLKVGEDAAKTALNQLPKGTHPNLAIVFCSIKFAYDQVIQGIKNVIGDTKVIGCSSAGEFNEKKVTSDGVVCALIASDTHRFYSGLGKQLKEDPMQSAGFAAARFPKNVPGFPHKSAILLLDGLAGSGEEAVLAAASILGPEVKFAGGAAADELKFMQTVVFEDKQIASDALVLNLIASKTPVIITVKHGHKPLSPPLKITRAEKNILYEIEGRPAIEVWKDYVRDEAKKHGFDVDTFKSPKEFSKILLKYEAGLMTGSDYKIRFPLSVNPDGSLNFVCSIMQGSVIKIMDSQPKDQVAAAREAAEAAMKEAAGLKIAGAIVFDCVCRAMILEDKFIEAVDAIKHVFGNIPLIGFETYGEIAMQVGQLSGFHNTTTVIMLIPD